MLDLSSWRRQLARLEDALRPLAKRVVDVSDPDWFAKLTSGPAPLDEAGVRRDAEALLHEILTQYASATDAERSEVRKLISEYPSFTWATAPAQVENPAATLRLRLVHFSLLDQGRDPRDAVLELEQLC